MKEFSKIGEYHVKDTQARQEIEEVKETLNNLPTSSNPLPEVSVDDNGKVLQVVNGLWGKGALPEATKETWTFTLENGTTLTKQVHVG